MSRKKIDKHRELFHDCLTLVAALRKNHPPSGMLRLAGDKKGNKGWLDGSRKMEKAFQKSSHVTALSFKGFNFTPVLEDIFTNVLMGLRNLEELNLIDCTFDQPPPNLSRGILELKKLRRFEVDESTRIDMDVLRSVYKLQVQSVYVPLYYLEKIHWFYIFRNIGLVELHLSAKIHELFGGITKKLSLLILKALVSSKTIKKFSGNIWFYGDDIARVFGQLGNPVEWKCGGIRIKLKKNRPHEILALKEGFSKAEFHGLDLNHPLFKNLLAVVERSAYSTTFIDEGTFWNYSRHALLDLATLSNPRLKCDPY